MSTHARGDDEYLISFMYDYLRYRSTYLMSYKLETFNNIIEFQVEVENQLGRKIKQL